MGFFSFTQNSKENLISLPTKEGKELIDTLRSVHSGPHGNQTVGGIRKKLDDWRDTAKLENWSKEQTLAKVKELINEEKLELLNGKDLKK